MAIAVETTFPGGTLDEYDGMLEQLGFHPQGQAEPGCLFHWVTKSARQMMVSAGGEWLVGRASGSGFGPG